MYGPHTEVSEVAHTLLIVMRRGILRAAEEITGHKYETIGHWLRRGYAAILRRAYRQPVHSGRRRPPLAVPMDLRLTQTIKHCDEHGKLVSHCPMCGSLATRIHSRYQRKLADLPSSGQPVRFVLTARKFFCNVSTCPRKIFAERLTPFVAPWARVTTRLFQMVQIIGLACALRTA